MSKVIFYSNVNPPPRLSSPCGRRYVEDFQRLTDPETGEKKLEVVGKIDMYEKTQLAKPDDLYTLLKKSGVEPSDVESLRVTKEYSETLIDDFVSAPRTLLEAHEVIQKAERSFDELPLEVKAEFDNSSGKMLKSLQDGTFENRLSKFIAPKNPAPDPEQTEVNNEAK